MTDSAEREARVVAEHLPPGYTAAFDSSSNNTGTSATAPDGDTPPTVVSESSSSLHLQGGDMHRDLYKMDARAQMPKHQRAATFHHVGYGDGDGDGGDDGVDHVMPASEQRAPQGFRRAFIRQRIAAENPHAAPRIPAPVAQTFVDFLDLYGSFAGEDLRDFDEDDEDDDGGDDEHAVEDEQPGGGGGGGGEQRPLLGRRRTTRSAPPTSAATASTAKTFFTLIKAFIGTGIMFLPKAFNNGGILFSSMVMLCVSAISMWAFHLLLQCKKQVGSGGGGGYGEIGHSVAGRPMRALVLGSIALSQLGFVCAGTVFVAENVLSFFQAVSRGHTSMTTTLLIGFQVVALIPLAWIRNISKLGGAAQVADMFIFIGLGYIYWYDVGRLAAHGISPTVVLFNPDRYTLTIGSAIFTFEGIGLILPIQSSMQKPQHFEWLLGTVMLLITVIFTSIGALCYATFGADTDIEVISNFPQDSRLVNMVQLLYALAVLIGTPVQLFPAMRILESRVFSASASGKRNAVTKWKKNVFRAALVVLCAFVAALGAGHLDFFVAIIGSLACIPLVYIYPPFLHYHAVAQSPWARAADVGLMVLGGVGMVYTSVVTVKNSAACRLPFPCGAKAFDFLDHVDPLIGTVNGEPGTHGAERHRHLPVRRSDCMFILCI
ncbi:hypothetical protein P8C59_003437 [Phyllachora maydis]|uniref:Amino acid transporter transmembrane domain-containing protein n=1 Tax=Phyllachora maydis TaxID=1825666 RepID=A0AAD9I0P4_9PEZI|nr:hypothetical protein P8C59_003437 [Phyllachora maydis]